MSDHNFETKGSVITTIYSMVYRVISDSCST